MSAKLRKSPRGRKPKNWRVKVLEGNPGKRPVYVPPENSKEVGPCPTGQPVEVQRVWRRAREEWGALLTRDDRRVLLDYCQIDAEAELAWVEMCKPPEEKGGRMIMTKTGDMAESPWARRWRNLRAERLKVLSALGATPTSRQRVPGGVVLPANKAKTINSAALTVEEKAVKEAESLLN